MASFRRVHVEEVTEIPPELAEALTGEPRFRIVRGGPAPRGRRCFVLAASGRPLALAVVDPAPPGCGREPCEVSIAVAPAARRSGLARRLLAEVMDRARAEGWPGLRAVVERGNRPARALFDALGFAAGGPAPEGYVAYHWPHAPGRRRGLLRLPPAFLAGLMLAGGLRAVLRQNGGPVPAAALDRPAAAARRLLAAPPPGRRAAAAELRRAGAAGGLALLAALERRPDGVRVPGVFDLCLELLPAQASGRLRRLLPALGPAERLAAARWYARRDLAGFREVAPARIEALFALVDGGGEAARVAAQALGSWDRESVARGLWQRLTDAHHAEAGGLVRTMARSLAKLRAAGALAGEVARFLREPRGEALAPELLPVLGEDPAGLLAGRLDPWLRRRDAAVRAGVLAALGRAEARLLERQAQAERLALWHRVHRVDPNDRGALLAEYEVAVLDLGATAGGGRTRGEVFARHFGPEGTARRARLAAIEDFLLGRPPGVLERAFWRFEALWAAHQPENGLRAAGAGSLWNWFAAWRRLVPPPIAARELEARRRAFERRGGLWDLVRRRLGRARLASALLGAVLAHLRGEEGRAQVWLRRAVRCFDELRALWDEDIYGPNRELDYAFHATGGVDDLLTRALEGNPAVQDLLPPAERKRRLARAEDGFVWLVRRLARALPDRVLPADPSAAPPQGEGERVYSDITGALIRFWGRIGEEEKAIALLDALIARLEAAGLEENRLTWADFLFERAQIAVDRKDAATGRRLLARYLAFFEDRLREVHQDPERFGDPEAARRFYAAKLAAGHVSLAVLHNVVLGDLATAREHCRRAYELEDSPFNRVLYACYLARDGKRAEALALLARVDPIPAVYYNMACTLALVGRKEAALHWLALDLERNHPTERSRARQRKWAREDRDLAALRGDPRFEALVGR